MVVCAPAFTGDVPQYSDFVIGECASAVAFCLSVRASHDWRHEIIIGERNVPSEKPTQHFERIVRSARSVVLPHLAEHSYDFRSLYLGNWPPAERRENIAPEGCALLIDTAELLHVMVSQILVLDNPPQCVLSRVSLVPFIGQRITPLGDLAEHNLGFASGLV